MRNPQSTWRRPAPEGSDAWYDLRRALAVTTERGRHTVFEALQHREIGPLQHAAEVVHELTHMQQDICTGWGYYQMELHAALTVTKIWLVKLALLRAPEARAPLVPMRVPDRLAPEEQPVYRRYLELLELWNAFNERNGRHLTVADTAVIESQAHVRQIAEHLYAGDLPGARQLLQADEEYIGLVRATLAGFFGPDAPVSPDRLLLVTLLHDALCDVAFAEPAPPVDEPKPPQQMTAQDLAALMPGGLVERFEYTLAVAMESLGEAMRAPLAAGRDGAHDIMARIARLRDLPAWLSGVRVATGPDLARSWLGAVGSAANGRQDGDPVRVYRSWAMTAWQPFEAATRFQGSLQRIMDTLPGFRLEQAGHEEWVVDLTPRHGAPPMQVRDDVFARCASDLDGLAMVDTFANEMLFGEPEPCPHCTRCPQADRVCATSLRRGLTPTCPAAHTLGATADIPLWGLTLREP